MGSTVKDRAFVAYIAEAQTWTRPFSRAHKLCVGYAPWATFTGIEQALIARGIPAERAADTAREAEKRLGRWVPRDGCRIKIVETTQKLYLPY